MKTLGIPNYTQDHHIEHFARAYRSNSKFYFEGVTSTCTGYDREDNKVYISNYFGTRTVTLNRRP